MAGSDSESPAVFPISIESSEHVQERKSLPPEGSGSSLEQSSSAALDWGWRFFDMDADSFAAPDTGAAGNLVR